VTKPITIICPTWNNEEFLVPCVRSIIQNGILDGLADLIIVNNGSQDIERHFGSHPAIKILKPGENLGWEGGLELGIKESKSPFLVFQNDDTYLPPSSASFYQRLLNHFTNDNVAAVGPATTCAAGIQSIYHPGCPRWPLETSYLIFFTVMVRRSHLEEVGGIDTSLPGGDDFDLSIRLRKAGHNILVDPGAFIIHHGFKTGTRVKGEHTSAGGWNSQEMSDRTNKYLINKHGFKAWWGAMRGLDYTNGYLPPEDKEGNLIRTMINGENNIVELGCGPQKTVEPSIGIDRVPKGEVIPHLQGQLSVADIVADVSEVLPIEDNSQDVVIARHILEHVLREIKTLKEWGRIVRPGGKLIIAVPDERVTQSIPLNPEHLRAYSEESLRDTMELLGWKTIETKSSQNGVSFVGVFQKPGGICA